MNPYQPPSAEVDHANGDFICSKCKQELERPGIVGTALGWMVIIAFVFLATHGLMAILKQYGIVVSTVYGDEFWFENQIRKMIWLQ